MKKKDIYLKLGYLIAAGVFLVLDQATKAWAIRKLRFGGDITVIQDFLNFSYAQNTGVAFSMFNGGGDTGRWFLSSLAFLAASLVIYFIWRTPRSDDRVLGSLALLLAGIVGNVLDRVRLGFVIDFIDFQFGNWHYPTFNVADIAICTGVGLLLLDMLFGKKGKDESGEKAPEESKEELAT